MAQQARLALFAHFLRQGPGQRVGAGALDRRIGEGADAVELGLVEKIQQFVELGFGLAGKAGDEGAADRQVRHHPAPCRDAVEHLFRRGRPLHQFEDALAGVLEGHVEVRQDLAFRHQRNQVVDARIGINVMQAHPEAEFAQFAAQLVKPRLHRPAAVEAGAVLDVDAVGAGVLRDHQQFLDAGRGQNFGFMQDVADRARDQVAAQRRDDAEAAAMVAAFGNLKVGVMVRRQAYALRRHQIDEGIVQRRQMLVHGRHDFRHGMRPGDGQHFRMHAANDVIARRILFCAEAAGNDDLAVFGQRLADGVERLLDRGIDEAAGIDDHQIGTLVGRRNEVTLGTQPGQDLF